MQKFSPNAFLEDESKCKVLNSYIDVGTTHASLDWFNFNRVYQFIDEIEEQQDKLNEYLREHNEIYRMIVYYNIKKASIVKSNQYYESFDKNLLYYYRNEISRILPIIDSKKEEVAPHRDILYERYPHYADAEIDRFKRYIMSYLNNNETDTIDLTSNNKIEFRSPVYYEPKSFNVRDDYENNRNQHSSIKSVYYYGNLTTRGSGRVPNSGDVDYYYEGKYRNNATSLGLSDNDNYYKYKNWINYSFDITENTTSIDNSGVENYIKSAYLYRELQTKYYELITKYIFYLTNVNEVQNDIWDSFIPKIGSVSEYNTNILAYIKNDVNGNNYTEYRDLIKEINDLNDDYEQSKSQLGGSFSTFTISDADIKTPEKYIMKNIIDNYGRIEGLPVEKIVKQTVEDDVHNYHLVLYENHEYRTLLKQWIDLSYSGDIDVGNSTLNEYLNELEKEQDRLRSEYGKTWVVIVEQNGNVVEDSTGKKIYKRQGGNYVKDYAPNATDSDESPWVRETTITIDIDVNPYLFSGRDISGIPAPGYQKPNDKSVNMFCQRIYKRDDDHYYFCLLDSGTVKMIETDADLNITDRLYYKTHEAQYVLKGNTEIKQLYYPNNVNSESERVDSQNLNKKRYDLTDEWATIYNPYYRVFNWGEGYNDEDYHSIFYDGKRHFHNAVKQYYYHGRFTYSDRNNNSVPDNLRNRALLVNGHGRELGNRHIVHTHDGDNYTLHDDIEEHYTFHHFVEYKGIKYKDVEIPTVYSGHKMSITEWENKKYEGYHAGIYTGDVRTDALNRLTNHYGVWYDLIHNDTHGIINVDQITVSNISNDYDTNTRYNRDSAWVFATDGIPPIDSNYLYLGNNDDVYYKSKQYLKYIKKPNVENSHYNRDWYYDIHHKYKNRQRFSGQSNNKYRFNQFLCSESQHKQYVDLTTNGRDKTEMDKFGPYRSLMKFGSEKGKLDFNLFKTISQDNIKWISERLIFYDLLKEIKDNPGNSIQQSFSKTKNQIISRFIGSNSNSKNYSSLNTWYPNSGYSFRQFRDEVQNKQWIEMMMEAGFNINQVDPSLNEDYSDLIDSLSDYKADVYSFSNGYFKDKTLQDINDSYLVTQNNIPTTETTEHGVTTSLERNELCAKILEKLYVKDISSSDLNTTTVYEIFEFEPGVFENKGISFLRKRKELLDNYREKLRICITYLKMRLTT